MVTMSKYTYRASTCGACARKISAERLGLIPQQLPASSVEILRKATLAEDIVIDLLVIMGYAISNRQEEYHIELQNFDFVGHIDGMTDKDGSVRVLEIKNLGKTSFARFKKKGLRDFKQYEYQVSAYMSLTELPLLMVVRNTASGSEEDDLSIIELEHPPVSFTDVIIPKLERIEKLARAGELADAEPGVDCFWCEYTAYCPIPDKVDEVVEEVPELAHYANMYREGVILETEAKEKLAKVKKVFTDYIKSSELIAVNGRRIIISDGLKVTLSMRKRETLQRELLRKVIPDEIIEECVKVTEYEEVRYDDHKDAG